MMQYGTTEIIVERGSVFITNKTRLQVRHFIDTDSSMTTDMGREATEITCTALANSEHNARTLEALMHTHNERELIVGYVKYKKVIPGDRSGFTPFARLRDGKWVVQLSFLALDPVPYNPDTEEALY